jgi:hypothetical protein
MRTLLVPFLSLTMIIRRMTASSDEGYNISQRLLMKKKNTKTMCERIPESYDVYLEALQEIYSSTNIDQTCAAQHLKCGWPMIESSTSDLPLYVFVVGMEGSGHHLWDGILKGVLDCNWV